MVKKLLNEKVLSILVVLMVALQPLIDMDYIIYPFLNKFGIPRLSTVIRFIVIPLVIIYTFFVKEKKKKRTFILAALYGIALLVYFVLHCKQGEDIYPALSLTTNFKFNVFQELTYVLTLVIPIVFVYSVYHCHFEEKVIRNITYFMSGFISIPIFLGDLFVFGKSTYYGYTVANFFSWFGTIYEDYHPRCLASKFFFNEGNTIGILMFALLPLMYYFVSKAENKKEKIAVSVLILIQSLSMQILGTRVATYGAVVVPVIFLVLYLFDALILKHQKVKAFVLGLCVACCAIFYFILPYTPAIQNQKVDAINDLALLTNGAAQEGKDALANAEDLVPGTAEYNHFYIYMFEQYGIKAHYANSIPSMYYAEYYMYTFDPKFWVDIILELPVEERVSGRQIEKIFFNYKYANITSMQKILGMGYSTFMNGSIVLESDFVQQIYTLGYAGELLAVCPWIFITFFGAILVLWKWKSLVKLDVMIYAVSLVAMFGCGYMSGHTLDQFVTSMFMALLAGILLNQVCDTLKKGKVNE